MRLNNAEDLEDLRKQITEKRDPKKSCITISAKSTCCLLRDSKEVVEIFEEEIKKHNLQNKIDLKTVGCLGFCEIEPVVIIQPNDIFYQSVKPEDVEEIIEETIIHNKIIKHLLYDEGIVSEKEIPFYKKQNRLVSGNNGLIDPECIEDYIAIGGYSALAKVLYQMKPERVIDEIKKSGLRGRGGGGFPAGIKWEACRNAEEEEKIVICNADEGDPGAYMDRSILEGNPHSVIEGLLIGAYAIGSNEGYIYVRDEYPLALKNLEIALESAREYGFVGKNIFNSGFNFTLRISRGAGAFVCGEETALIASIEGRDSEPRQKPPFPVQKGLWDKPTNINNVETWVNIPLIINKGANRYSEIGTPKSKGTKVFSLVGKINNTGLVEVPMGITLREIIYDIGGGIPNNKKFKAVQTGGPSGGCIPESLIDLPVDFDELTKAGSMMGSGGMIVMDENTCMVDIAKYFISFLQEESCGKCVPCREGLERMGEVLTNICEGRGCEGDIRLLEELSYVVKEASLCALGRTAPNSVLTTIRYFRDEYEAHIKEKRCPAGVCKELIQYSIDPEICTGCMACTKVCPQEAITGKRKKLHILDQSKCIKCGACREVCKFDAIIVK